MSKVINFKNFTEKKPSKVNWLYPVIHHTSALLLGEDDTMLSIPIVGWGMDEKGVVNGLIPFYEDNIIFANECDKGASPLSFIGYEIAEGEHVDSTPPHVVEAVLKDYENMQGYVLDDDVVACYPDISDTHAIIYEPAMEACGLHPVVSWQLSHEGVVTGLIGVETDGVVEYGDRTYQVAEDTEGFICLLTGNASEALREGDEGCTAAVSMMVALYLQGDKYSAEMFEFEAGESKPWLH